MRTITLIRTQKNGKAVRGTLSYQMRNRDYELETFTSPTLENADYLIPAGTYPVENTWSPKFKKFLPLIKDVPDYSDQQVTGVPDGCQQSASGGESKGRSCPTDLAERYRSSQSPCRMRQGIRIHMGSKPEHSKGCILLNLAGMANINCLFNQLEDQDEEAQIEIMEHFAL
jgi:HrpA-like RNA helicase